MATGDAESGRAIEREILVAIEGLRYGSVEIVIHDSRVVQIERRERVRLDRPLAGQRPSSRG